MKLSDFSRDQVQSLRQIAMVIDGLDHAAANAILERLPAKHERIVRDEMVELHQVDPVEREIAARQFYHRMLEDMESSPVCETVQESCVTAECESTAAAKPPVRRAALGGAVAAIAAVTGAVAAVEGSRCSDACEGAESLAESICDASGESHGVAHAGESRGAGHCDSETSPHAHALHSESQDDVVAAELEHIPQDLRPLREVIDAGSLEHLAAVIRDEQPQTVALVMAAMLPEEAAGFIGGWPSAEQGEILRRIAKLGHTDPVVVETVRSSLLHQLHEYADETARGEEGRERVQAIVAAAQGSVRHDLLGGLAEADRELFRQVAVAADQSTSNHAQSERDEFDPHLAAVAFDRFVDLSDAGLERVFDELDPDVAVLALAGASQPCLSDVLERLPEARSESLRRRLENIGSLRLGDIQRAQLMAVAASHHILSDGAEIEPVRHLKLTA